MTLRRDLNIYVKMNAIGVLGIIILMIYILVNGLVDITRTEYTMDESVYEEYLKKAESDPDTPFVAYVQLFTGRYARLVGIVGCGFYLHNISLPIIAKNPNKETNERDLFIGYASVFFTYIFFGVVGYLGFSAESYKSHWKDGEI